MHGSLGRNAARQAVSSLALRRQSRSNVHSATMNLVPHSNSPDFAVNPSSFGSLSKSDATDPHTYRQRKVSAMLAAHRGRQRRRDKFVYGVVGPLAIAVRTIVTFVITGLVQPRTTTKDVPQEADRWCRDLLKHDP